MEGDIGKHQDFRADTGAVTLIQRFGSAANLNIHLHCLVLDGERVRLCLFDISAASLPTSKEPKPDTISRRDADHAAGNAKGDDGDLAGRYFDVFELGKIKRGDRKRDVVELNSNVPARDERNKKHESPHVKV